MNDTSASRILTAQQTGVPWPPLCTTTLCADLSYHAVYEKTTPGFILPSYQISDAVTIQEKHQ